jgi:poly(hydroxyalkanoate) depolymerase family esterase
VALIRCWKPCFDTQRPTERKKDVPRQRRSRAPGSALMKALIPRPTRSRKRRSAVTRIKFPTVKIPTVKIPTVKIPTVKIPTGAANSRVAKAPARLATKGTTKAASQAVRRTQSGDRPPGRGTWHQFRYSGVAGSRSYRVYVPFGLRRTTRAPLLLALHGCSQNSVDFATSTRFNQLADQNGFVVVYPEQTPSHNPQRCWNWFRPAHQFRSQGEPAILAGIVRRVAAETAAWRIDPSRMYVTGLSAGGAMAVVLAATYPEMFAAVGVHSAPPYRSASSPTNAIFAMRGRTTAPGLNAVAPMPPMIVFQGTLDGTVHSGNAQRIADQWLATHAGVIGAGTVGSPRTRTTDPARPATSRSRRGYQVSRWSLPRGRSGLEVWLVAGLAHAWSGGSSGQSFSDPRGPRASTAMWRFFSKHRAVPVVTLAASSRAG